MLHVIAGTDTFRKAEAIAEIIEAGGYERFNVDTIEDVINEALSQGLFSKKAMVFEGKEIPYKDSMPLEAIVKVENAVILNVTTVDGRKPVGKWLNQHDYLQKFDTLTQWQEDKIKAEISKRSHNLGLSLSRHSIQYLLEAVGPDIGRLQRELELIKAYFGDNQVITTELPELVPNYAQNSYQLAKALTQEPETVYERTQSLLDLGIHPLPILATLTNRIERLMLVEIAREGQIKTKEEIAKFANVLNPKQVFYLIQDGKYLSVKQLQQAFVELDVLTHRLKRGTPSERLPLELALIAAKLA